MLLAGTVLAAFATYFIMVGAFYMSRYRMIHVPSMVAIILFDLAMPFYLYATGDWKGRLIDNGEILSFLIWMHVGLLIALYGLYLVQVKTGIGLLGKRGEARASHRSQALGILVVRALVVVTGALLYEPPGDI